MKSALPTDIDYYTINQVLLLLDISESTLRRASRLLRKKLKSEFDRVPYEHGYSPESFQILQEYFRLRRLGMSVERAANHIRINGV